MAAYIVAFYDIADAAAYQAYPPAVMPLLQKHKVEVLVADFGTKALEGGPRSACVVLRFESEDAALAWYNDPEYAPVRKMRLDSTVNGNMLLAKSFAP
ncbi:MAG: DUF1330 domain-containing protein [Nevskia sp.]|nr:DUF1330 domain-containing protein [Nevskia sp.]